MKKKYEFRRIDIAADLEMIAGELEELGAVYDRTPNEVKKEIDDFVRQLDLLRSSLLSK